MQNSILVGLKKIILLSFVLVLLSTAVFVRFIRPVEASGIIYIRADGSIDPPTAPISSVDNVTYTLTGNINGSIFVERDNIVIDGADYTLQGTQSGTGLDLTERNNITIRNMGIDAFHYGIWLYTSSNINVNANNITNNHNGIYLWDSSNNTISENNMEDNSDYAVYLHLSSNNTVYRNTVAGNWYSGIIVDSSSYNRISENSITFSLLGIWLFQSSSSTVSKNYILYTSECAIKLEASNSNNIFGNGVTTNNNHGIFLEKSSTNILSENDITNNNEGILLEFSSHNTILRNNVVNNYEGIMFWVSQNNRAYKNNVARNTLHGLLLEWSPKNIIHANTIESNNYDGIWLYESSNNNIYYNNFLDNAAQVHSFNSTNVWDDSYPSGGNYWSDYADVDLSNGPDQNETGSDGIGDTAYVIDANNRDNYPLMGMFYDFSVTSEYNVQTICNSTISDFQFNGTSIIFNVTGENGAAGFCRVCIPRALMNETCRVFVNGTEVPHSLLSCSNSTHSYVYFTHNHSTLEVIIIPESFMEEIPSPFWMQWWLWTIVAVVIVGLGGAIYFLRKRKPLTPTAPTPPTEGTLQNTTQNTNPLNSYLPSLL